MAEITYCSNIHPGESWRDIMHNLTSHVLDVKRELNLNQPFPLGLRIAHQALLEADNEAIAEFKAWCTEHNCYLLTINGFPYGTFHNSRVKEQVYLPDWTDPARVTYSKALGDLAVKLAPDTKRISISTVPIAFRPTFDSSTWPAVKAHVVGVAEHYYNLYQETGILLVLSIEPEPMCIVETTEELIEFFQHLDLPEHLRPYVGVCFDCCHQAVEFENASACLTRLLSNQIPIGKVQVSSALKARGAEIQNLLKFDEPVYLHQVVARRKATGELDRYTDLQDFRHALSAGDIFDECRVHFHVPIFLDRLGECGTTQDFLYDLLPQLSPDTPLEVETYSFSAIPEHLRTDSLGQSITRELAWVHTLLGHHSQ